MWRRVEFNKDGSVKSVKAVESRGGDGGSLICYVDADSDAQAIKAALSWREKYRATQRASQLRVVERRRAQGLPAGPSVSGVTATLSGDVPAPTPDVISRILAAAKQAPAMASFSGGAVARALAGEAAPLNSLTAIRRAMRRAGYTVGTTQCIKKSTRGSIRAKAELELLRAVLDWHRTLTRAAFEKRLHAEIEKRDALVKLAAAQLKADKAAA